ncbi:LysR family transcriptional regulator [Pseudoroseicyclus sp. CXY001]|uniref:LysR family transcriptional regulator n=1 Tax=Pseudoroseicyclus sp. CXY001 TaxID=3242492 RepID=UPI00358DD4CD
MSENWDDLRFVLAVAETGAVSAAAKALGVNHATVLRRIGAFEAAHGTMIFRREAAGYAVLPGQLPVIERARDVARAIEAVARAARGGAEAEERPIRLTSTDSLCQYVLPELLAEVAAEGAAVELYAANHHVDLGRLAADLTVRPARALPPDLSGSIAARMGFAAYAAEGGAESWLGLRGPLARAVPADWLEREAGASGAARGGADSFLVLARMAAAGMGRAVLPCIVGDAAPELRRLPIDLSHVSVPIWVASHVGLADAPRLATIRTRLARALRQRAAALSGWPTEVAAERAS